MSYIVRNLKNKTSIDMRLYPDEVQSDKGRNLYFIKDGSTFLSPTEHPDADSAIAASNSWFEKWGDNPYPVMGIVGRPTGRDHLYAIPMPVK